MVNEDDMQNPHYNSYILQTYNGVSKYLRRKWEFSQENAEQAFYKAFMGMLAQQAKGNIKIVRFEDLLIEDKPKIYGIAWRYEYCVVHLTSAKKPAPLYYYLRKGANFASIDILNGPREPLSLNQPLNREDGATLGELLPDLTFDIEEALAESLAEKVAEAVFEYLKSKFSKRVRRNLAKWFLNKLEKELNPLKNVDSVIFNRYQKQLRDYFETLKEEWGGELPSGWKEPLVERLKELLRDYQDINNDKNSSSVSKKKGSNQQKDKRTAYDDTQNETN